MTIKVDPEANAAYIAIEPDRPPGVVAKTHVCDIYFESGSIHFDLDRNGRLIGIEILGLSNVVTARAMTHLQEEYHRA